MPSTQNAALNHMQVEQGSPEKNAKEYYGILRTRQLQIIQIIKETSLLLARTEGISKRAGGHVEKNVSDGLKIAFSMINSLSAILDEQVNALDVWERVLLDERRRETTLNPHDSHPDYYEINPN